MITVTEKARDRISSLMKDQEITIEGVHLGVKGVLPTMEYALAFVPVGKKAPTDVAVDAEGIRFFMERRYENFLEDVKIDFIDTLHQSGFKVENPKVVMPKIELNTSPSLDTPEAKAVKKVLDEEINPGVASHGGHISLIDVKDHIAYIQMGGGCQGCGSADVTLKQGVITAIKKSVPEIVDVLDTTDHADGRNPYFASRR